MENLDSKRIILTDNDGKTKEFTIVKLGAIPAICLMREVCALMMDTSTIKALVLQQFIQRVLNTGVAVSGADSKELERLARLDEPTIIANIVQSITYGLSDEGVYSIISKAFARSVMENAGAKIDLFRAIEADYVPDPMMVLVLLKEAFTLNFSGAISKLKKMLGQQLTTANSELS